MARQIPECKKFNGYKPCKPYADCWSGECEDFVPIGKKVLIINLDAMGDVLMTTAQLKSIKKKYPESTVTWVTLKVAAKLLQNNPYIDKVMEYNFETISILNEMDFDVVMSSDKSQRSCALANSVRAPKKYGFGLNEHGQIVPFNKAADYNYILGLNDQLKFRENKRVGEDYLAETFELEYNRDEYVFEFTDEEKQHIENYKKEIDLKPDDKIIGFNTGCSELFPNKKMTLEQHEVLIERFLSYGDYKIMLLGGPEDTERNNLLAAHFGDKIINTPTTEGVRRGACYESLPHVVITGDTFGMHLAIALKKYVIAWFGLSCWTEIDLFDRGVILAPEGLDCAPCWNKKCPKDLECIQMIDLERIEKETIKYFEEKDI